MALPVTNYGDNAFVPGVAAYAYIPDQLIAGHHNLVTQDIVLGAGALLRGTVMGQQTALSAAVVAGTNTGNGTVGALTPGAAPEVGSPYLLTAISPTVFSVVDPEGVSLANATVGTAYASGELNFTITAGSTAFVAGDKFSITFTQGIGTFIASVKTATDGSQVPSGILVDNADASLGPVRAGIYVSGEFNVNAIIADSSWTTATLTQAMRAFGINLKPALTAADPLF